LPSSTPHILYPFHLRNIIVQAAVDQLVEARWTDEIHDEWMRNLMVQVPAIPLERLQVTCQLMNSALPTATIRGYEEHIPRVTLQIQMIVMSSQPESPPTHRTFSRGTCVTFRQTS
jgi:hypothetical protein